MFLSGQQAFAVVRQGLSGQRGRGWMGCGALARVAKPAAVDRRGEAVCLRYGLYGAWPCLTENATRAADEVLKIFPQEGNSGHRVGSLLCAERMRANFEGVTVDKACRHTPPLWRGMLPNMRHSSDFP